jgi:hypothetical protein
VQDSEQIPFVLAASASSLPAAAGPQASAAEAARAGPTTVQLAAGQVAAVEGSVQRPAAPTVLAAPLTPLSRRLALRLPQETSAVPTKTAPVPKTTKKSKQSTDETGKPDLRLVCAGVVVSIMILTLFVCCCCLRQRAVSHEEAITDYRLEEMHEVWLMKQKGDTRNAP